jgi:4-amino-4-deoxy-L-arabinose transferase-like glycosyltransferase
VTEREWREASDMRQATTSLAAILVAAGALRFLGVGAGMSYPVAPGEAAIVERAVGMMQAGTLHPGSFEQPALYVYVQFATAILRFMTGALSGEWRTLADAAPADFYVWGRAVTALMGTATVLLVYLIGLRWGTRPALLAAGLVTVMPLHVRESQLVHTGVPATFFVALALLLSLRGHEQPRAAAFALAGAAAGLAAATRYSSALALLLPLVAIWMTPATRPSRLAAALASVAAAAVAFLLASPYTILDLPGFLDGLAAVGSAAAGDRPASPLLAHLDALRRTMHWPAFVLLFGGVVFAGVRAARGPGRVRWTLALAFPFIYLWFAVRYQAAPGASLLPLLPFASLLVATVVVSGVSLLRRFSIPRTLRTALIVALTVAVILPPSIAAVNVTRMARKAGRDAAAAGARPAGGVEAPAAHASIGPTTVAPGGYRRSGR